MTLLQILLRRFGWWKESGPASTFYNPINAKVGKTVSLDMLDYRGLNFFVEEIRENQAGAHTFVDYVLHAKPIDKADVEARLRLVPDPKGVLSHRAILLSLMDEMAYNEGLHGVVKDDTGKFIVDDAATGQHDEYWRVNDVLASYASDIKSMKGEGDEHEAEKVEFWDYSRMTTIEGVEREQFVFVEMNSDNGWFQVWQGTEVNPEKVSVY